MKIKIKLSAKSDYIPNELIGTTQNVTYDFGTHWQFKALLYPSAGRHSLDRSIGVVSFPEEEEFVVRKKNVEIIQE
jgi:hypothetical protein